MYTHPAAKNRNLCVALPAAKNTDCMSVIVEALVKNYGTQRALDGISFEARPGEVLGFLGPNGAGEDDDDENPHRLHPGPLRPGIGLRP